MSIQPVYIYGATDRHKEKLRAAKQDLGLDFQCQFVLARPEQGGRVLAFEEPPFLCDRLNPTLTTPHSALQWALGMLDLPEARGYAEVLSEWLGAEVKEVPGGEDDPGGA